MSETINFTTTESILINVANLIEENKYYWVAIGGSPMMAMMLARKTHSPRAYYVVEDGTICPDPLEYVPFLSGASGAAEYRAVAWKDMNTVGFHCAMGYYDYGILDCLQVDMYGNINSTFIGGTYEHPERRFGGPGGANEIASMCWQTIFMADQEKRKYPRRVDFISSPGYLDGSPRARERAGLPANTGPYRVVSEIAMFGFDEETHMMKLLAIAPWVTLDDLLAEMDFEPLIADPLEKLPPPTEQQLTVLRAEIDPGGRVLGQGTWIEYTPED
ncbi:MAG: acyl CoA--acetate/3-ketoacid CoA transferase subunit beta [Dehalococcoidales bacterium]|nr:acyl CoA--acetate/3-ketoacid CoA transferase subunit beta [Dehalococcoidales bacterium]